MKDIPKSFNPYFNGFTTLTKRKDGKPMFMDLGFNPYFNGFTTLTNRYTLYICEK